MTRTTTEAATSGTDDHERSGTEPTNRADRIQTAEATDTQERATR
jgi:hypothetical protein